MRLTLDLDVLGRHIHVRVNRPEPTAAQKSAFVASKLAEADAATTTTTVVGFRAPGQAEP